MKIIFIQPGSFLRTQKKTNPFFDPLIETVDRAGIDWEIWLHKEVTQCGYPKDRIRHYGYFSFFGCWFWRLMHVLCPWMSVARVHSLFGRLARPFCRAWREADLVIIIANTFAHELISIRKGRRLADVQHGVIYSRHSGYFLNDQSLMPALRPHANFEFWVYGPGYRDCFFKNPENHKWLDGRVKVIGDVVRAGVLAPCSAAASMRPPSRPWPRSKPFSMP